VLNILYIGNSPDAIAAFSNLKKEFDFHQESDSLKAVSYLKEGNKPDAIVCEARLQGMNGLAVGKLIRGVEGFSKTPFILFLFEKDSIFVKRAFEERKIVDDIYQFPFDLTRLSVRIEYILRFYNSVTIDKKPTSAYRDYKIPFIKRIFDIVASSIALILLSPLFLFVSIAIRIETKGYPIYKSKRVGTNYQIFNFLKFRSMYLGSDKRLKDLKQFNQYSDGIIDNANLNFDCPECSKLPDGKRCSPVLYIYGNKICEF